MGTEGIPGGAHHPIGILTPHESEVHEAVHRRIHRRGEFSIEACSDLFTGRRFVECGDRLGDLQGETIQTVQGSGYGGRRPSPRGQCTEISRDGVEQVQPGAQQFREGIVIAVAKVVGEAAHPSNATRRLPRVSDPVIGFDLDMTLVDSAAGIIASVQHVCASYGVVVEADEIAATIGLPLDRVFPTWLPDEPYEVLLGGYREHYAEHGVPLSIAMPGAVEVVDRLRAEGARILVVTAKHGPIAQRVLEVAGLHADVVVGEAFAEQKAQVLLDHGARTYVGDHPGDMRAARLASARAIGVATGPTSAEALWAEGADIVLPDLTDSGVDTHIGIRLG